MSADSLTRTAAVELIDHHGRVLATVPATCTGKNSLHFEATHEIVEQAWTLRAIDAAGNVLDEGPTPVARGMRELAESLAVAFDKAGPTDASP